MSQNVHRWTHFPSFDRSWKGLNGSLTLNKTESPIHEFYHWSFRVHFYISQIGCAKRFLRITFTRSYHFKLGSSRIPGEAWQKSMVITYWGVPTWSLTVGPLKATETTKRKGIFQHSFLRGELLNFGGVTFGICLNLVEKFLPPVTTRPPILVSVNLKLLRPLWGAVSCWCDHIARWPATCHRPGM